MSEKTLFNHFTLLFSKLGSRLFRNNSAVGWQGEITRLRDGSMLIKNPRPINAGLAKGSADSIGFYRHKITHADLGRTYAIFSSVEYKSKTGRLSDEQQNWHALVTNNGGVSLITNEILSAEQLHTHITDQLSLVPKSQT